MKKGEHCLGNPLQRSFQKPNNGIYLHVGQFHSWITLENLIQEFSKYGKVLNGQITRNVKSGKSLTMAFIKVATKEDASAILEAKVNLRGGEVRTRTIKKKKPPLPIGEPVFKMVMVRNIDIDVTEEMGMKAFGRFGELEHFYLADRRGFAGLSYHNEEALEKLMWMSSEVADISFWKNKLWFVCNEFPLWRKEQVLKLWKNKLNKKVEQEKLIQNKEKGTKWDNWDLKVD